MQPDKLREHLVDLIRRTSCELSLDVAQALKTSRDNEEGRARSTLDWILTNAEEAAKSSVPMCQDTGTLIFSIEHGPDTSPQELEMLLREATAEATRRSYLRPNAVDAISGKNSGDNVGTGSPYVHFHSTSQEGSLLVRLMLKGGGSENCGVQYSLPDSGLGAGRDIKGIKRCILDATLKAQGFGCAPGTLGVGVGGDRMSSYFESKQQFWRSLDDRNPDPVLAQIEEEMLQKANQLTIGPMGFGGKTTLFGVKIGTRHRVPASFFVSISYMCWAFRRRTMELKQGQIFFR